jgi:hypothetical protein
MVFWLQSASASSSDIGSAGTRAQAAGSVMGSGSLTAATDWIASEATTTTAGALTAAGATTFNLI